MSPARASDTIGPKAFETKLKNPRSSVVMAERSRAYVCLYDCYSATKTVCVRTRLRPMRKKFCKVQKQQFSLSANSTSHNNILNIGEWQSLQIDSWGKPKFK